MLATLKASMGIGKAKAKFILATDGKDFEAEDLISGQNIACAFKDFPDHFGFSSHWRALALFIKLVRTP